MTFRPRGVWKLVTPDCTSAGGGLQPAVRKGPGLKKMTPDLSSPRGVFSSTRWRKWARVTYGKSLTSDSLSGDGQGGEVVRWNSDSLRKGNDHGVLSASRQPLSPRLA